MNIILEAFTKGYCEVTFIDSLIILVVILIPFAIYFFITGRRESK